MISNIRKVTTIALLGILFAVGTQGRAATESLRSGGYFCGTDGSCQFYKPGDPDWLFQRFTCVMGYADCAGTIAEWRAKSPGCRLVLYTTGSDMPAFKNYSSNSYLLSRKSTYVRDRMVELGDIEENAYMHFYDDTRLRNWNGSSWDTVLIPGVYSMAITAADSVSRVVNSYVNYLFHSGNTYEGSVRLSPNFANANMRLAYKEYITQAFNSQMTTHWPEATGYWDGIYFDNFSPYAMVAGTPLSGGHIVETGTAPGDLLQLGSDEYREWSWEWMKQFGREVRDTLQLADQWAADGRKKVLAYNVGINYRDDYTDPEISGADAFNFEFGFDPVYSSNESYYRLENLHTRDSTAATNGVTFFWTSRPRTSYGNGSVATSQAIYNNLCFYYVARSDSTWIFMRPEPGNAYGVFYNPEFDTLAWIPAMEYELGPPAGHYDLWDSGSSPDQGGATYKIWVRDYQYGRVFCRPRDGFDARWGDNSTPISVDLGGSYRQVQIDGNLGPIVTSVLLHGAEGVILIPYTAGECTEPPTIPAPSYPPNGDTVSSPSPELCVANSSSVNCSQPTRYHFQVAADAAFANISAENNTVAEGPWSTCWQVPIALAPGHTYYWRVRASNGITTSNWSAAISLVVGNEPPSEPMLIAPANGMTVATIRPVLEVANSSDPEGAALTYHFQVSPSSGFAQIAAEAGSVPEGPSTTSWQVDPGLANQSTYYWRVRAHDGFGYSPWSGVRSFSVNQTTAPPPAPTLNSPAYGSNVTDQTPTLVVNNSVDENRDILIYLFEVFDSAFTVLIEQSQPVAEGQSTTSWTVGSALEFNTSYWWHARSFDGQQYSAWMAATCFTVVQQENHFPTVPVPRSPVDGDTVVGSVHVLAVNNSYDVDGDPLTYDFRVFSDPALTKQVEIGWFVLEMQPYTYYYTTGTYTHDHAYYWRARANDGHVWTDWCAPEQFWHVDVILDAEDAPRPVFPEPGAVISQTRPVLQAAWAGAQDSLPFLFEVSADEQFVDLYALGISHDLNGGVVEWQLEPALDNDVTYYWRVRRSDGGYSETASFSVSAPVFVSPNPFSYYDGELTIHNLPLGATLEIFTASGDKVIQIDSVAGDFAWDVRNAAGEKLGSGVYLFYVTAGEERTSGKFIVVR